MALKDIQRLRLNRCVETWENSQGALKSQYTWEMVPVSRLYLYLCLGVEYVVGTETAPGLGISGRRFPCPAAQPPVGLGQGW